MTGTAPEPLAGLRERVTLTSGDLFLLDPESSDEDPVVPLVVVSSRPVALPHGVVYVLRDDLPLVEEPPGGLPCPGGRLQRLVRPRTGALRVARPGLR